MVTQTHRSVRGERAPSIGDPEPLPRELKHVRPRERPADKFDSMYRERVAAGQIEHQTSKQLWREREIAKLTADIAVLEVRAVAARGSGAHYVALCSQLQNRRYRLRKILERSP
jgi:hypothetical protein